MNDPNLPSLIVGSGSTGAVMWLWIKDLLKKEKRLLGEAEENHRRERQLATDTLEALLLNKSFLENHQGELLKMGTTMSDELEALRNVIQRLSDEPGKSA